MYTFAIIEKWPKTMIHHVEPNSTVWATAKRRILRKKDDLWEGVATFPFCTPRDFFGFTRPTARLMRADKCNVFVTSVGNLLGIRGGWTYAFQLDGKPVPLFALQGDCVLHRGICEGRDGWVYLGEYFMNPKRGPVRIWRISLALDKCEVAYEFPVGKIRHVHGVFNDSFDSNALWITVGDFAGECYFFRTTDSCQTMTPYGNGTQMWRAVTLFFTESHICWLTDSHLDQNFACRMDRTTAKIEVGQKIDSSTWYGATTAEGLHIAFTTVEKGPAILSNESSMLVSTDAFHWDTVCTYPKDFYRPIRLFKAGNICCPTGANYAKQFYISGEGLVGLDGLSLCLRINPQGSS